MQPFSERELRAVLLFAVILVISCVIWAVRQFHPGLLHPKPELLVDLSQDQQPDEITVHVVGEVTNPGLYQLACGSRVADAIAAAGGATEDADLTLLNQALVLIDGRQVRVPCKMSKAADHPEPTEESPLPLNLATQADLEKLPGIGPVTARQIIKYRDTQGGFSSVEELLEVKGIGPKTLERIGKRVIVY